MLFITRRNRRKLPYKPGLSFNCQLGRIKSNEHLPLDVVFPIEDLLQEGNESKCANEYETKRSVAEYVFPRRGVDICHPSAQHPADGDTRSGVSPRCIQDRHRCCLLPSGRDDIHHFAFFQAIFSPPVYHCFHAAASPPRIASIGGYDRSCARNQRPLLPANEPLSVNAAKPKKKHVVGGGNSVVFLGSIRCELSECKRACSKRKTDQPLSIRNARRARGGSVCAEESGSHPSPRCTSNLSKAA